MIEFGTLGVEGFDLFEEGGGFLPVLLAELLIFLLEF